MRARETAEPEIELGKGKRRELLSRRSKWGERQGKGQRDVDCRTRLNSVTMKMKVP